MKKLPKGTQIGACECPGCGRPDLPLKVNSAGCVYFFCANVIGTNAETGKPEKCFARFNWGRAASKRLISDYLQQEQENNAEKVHDREEIRAGEEAEAGRPDSENHGFGDQPENGGEGDDQFGNTSHEVQHPEAGAGSLTGAIKHFFTG